MKAFLRSTDGTFHLLPKVTTIGREKCNLILQTASVASQHAVIEYCDLKDWYVLQDLDTMFGTSVNGSIIKNTAIQLKSGDVIRFGSHPVLYEFYIDTLNKGSSPTQNHFLTRSQLPSEWCSSEMVSLPQLIRPNNASGSSIVNWPAASDPHGSAVLPRPPICFRPRSLTSVTRRPSTEKLPLTTLNGGGPSLEMMESMVNSSSGCSSASPHNHPDELQTQMKHLSEEVTRLLGIESECKEKEETIVRLRDEVVTLQRILRQKDIGSDVDPGARLRLLQMESGSRKISTTHNSLSTSSTAGPMMADSQSNASIHFRETSDMSTELEQMRKDRSMSLGLITQMQRDMTNKDVMIGKLTKEIERLKKEMLEKENDLTALKSSMKSNSEENQMPEENLIEKEKEVALLNHKLKSAESQKRQSAETVSLLNREISQLRSAVESHQTAINQYKLEIKTTKSKYEDLERAERLVRVALEQISKRLEKLRSHVIQTAFCAARPKILETKISDDDLLLALKKCAEERVELGKKMKAYEEKQQVVAGKKTTSSSTVGADNAKKLKQQLSDSVSSGNRKL